MKINWSYTQKNEDIYFVISDVVHSKAKLSESSIFHLFYSIIDCEMWMLEQNQQHLSLSFTFISFVYAWIMTLWLFIHEYLITNWFVCILCDITNTLVIFFLNILCIFFNDGNMVLEGTLCENNLQIQFQMTIIYWRIEKATKTKNKNGTRQNVDSWLQWKWDKTTQKEKEKKKLNSTKKKWRKHRKQKVMHSMGNNLEYFSFSLFSLLFDFDLVDCIYFHFTSTFNVLCVASISAFLNGCSTFSKVQIE